MLFVMRFDNHFHWVHWTCVGMPPYHSKAWQTLVESRLLLRLLLLLPTLLFKQRRCRALLPSVADLKFTFVSGWLTMMWTHSTRLWWLPTAPSAAAAAVWKQTSINGVCPSLSRQLMFSCRLSSSNCAVPSLLPAVVVAIMLATMACSCWCNADRPFETWHCFCS